MSGLPLHGRVALVTGGGRRTGRAIALALLAMSFLSRHACSAGWRAHTVCAR